VSAEAAGAATGAAPQRVAKLLARAGLCSRRDAERWIAEGRVTVDGTVLSSPAVAVAAASDIRVDGRPLPPPGYRDPYKEFTKLLSPGGAK